MKVVYNMKKMQKINYFNQNYNKQKLLLFNNYLKILVKQMMMMMINICIQIYFYIFFSRDDEGISY